MAIYTGRIPDSLFDVKRYLRKHHKAYEDPIPSKSTDRVLTSMARSIRRTPPLPKGPCQLCMTESDKLVPIQLKICLGCLKSFLKKTGNVRLQKREYVDFYCDWCFGRGFTSYLINPFIDKRCMDKLGRKHRMDMGSLKNRMAIDRAKRPF